MPSPRGRILRLAAIGTAGGLFSGLFGVGGGSVMVPLLLLWLGYEERAAAATSLGAIAVIAAFAAATQGVYGNVDVLAGVLVGVPVVGGVLLGTWSSVSRATRSPSRSPCCWWSARSSWCSRERPARTGLGWPVIVAALIGVLAGVAAGLLGIGGGILFVPALTIAIALLMLNLARQLVQRGRAGRRERLAGGAGA